MKFGVSLFPTDETMDLVSIARIVEELGFESLFVSDHTHIPISRQSHPLGGDVPREYARILDPFVVLGIVAAATKSLRVGTAVCLVTERDPIVLAKQVATLDFLSRGRVILGVGPGWNRMELINHGVDPSTRFAVFRERVLAMKEIWTHDEASFHGRFVNFDAMWSCPKPLQRPHPPILVAGWSEGAVRRAVEFGDGWIPTFWAVAPTLDEKLSMLRVLADATGKPMPGVTMIGASGKNPASDADPDPRALEEYASKGISRWVFRLPSAPHAVLLERLAWLADRIRRLN